MGAWQTQRACSTSEGNPGVFFVTLNKAEKLVSIIHVVHRLRDFPGFDGVSEWPRTRCVVRLMIPPETGMPLAPVWLGVVEPTEVVFAPDSPFSGPDDTVSGKSDTIVGGGGHFIP